MLDQFNVALNLDFLDFNKETILGSLIQGLALDSEIESYLASVLVNQSLIS